MAADITKKFDKLVLRRFRPSQGTVGVVPTQSGTYILIPKPCIEIGPRGGCVTSHVGNKRRWSEMEKQFFTSQTNMTPEEVKAYVKDQTGMNATTVMDYSPLLTTNGPASMPKPYEGPQETTTNAAPPESPTEQQREGVAAFEQLVRSLRSEIADRADWGFWLATSDMSRIRENLDDMQRDLYLGLEKAEVLMSKYVGEDKARSYAEKLVRPFFLDAARLELESALSEGPYYDAGNKGGLNLADEKMIPRTPKQRDFHRKAMQYKTQLSDITAALRAGKPIKSNDLFNIAMGIEELASSLSKYDMGLGKWTEAVRKGLVRDFKSAIKAHRYLQDAGYFNQPSPPPTEQVTDTAQRIKREGTSLVRQMEIKADRMAADVANLKEGPDALNYVSSGIDSLWEMAKAQFESIPGITPEKAEKYASRAVEPFAAQAAGLLVQEAKTIIDNTGFDAGPGVKSLADLVAANIPNTLAERRLPYLSESLQNALSNLAAGKPDKTDVAWALTLFADVKKEIEDANVTGLRQRLWLVESILSQAKQTLEKIQ